MPAYDYYHHSVRRALEADGWNITHDPLTLKYGGRNAFVDLGAEGPLAASKGGRKIAVEIKSFLGTSDITNIERALGQFVFYGHLLSEQDPERTLYLAMPERAFIELFDTIEGAKLIRVQRLRLIVVDESDRIVTWIETNTPQ